jgi:hypothetical protein
VSVPVDVERLQEQTETFGSLAYVVTVNDDGRPHVVSAAVTWQGDRLLAGAGRRTGANAAARPSVTLLWPATVESDGDEPGFSLLVDGSAELVGEQIAIRPESAILHRTATAPTGSRTSDCADV